MSKHSDQRQTTDQPRQGGRFNLLAFALGAVAVAVVLALAMAGGSPAAHAEGDVDIKCAADTDNNGTIDRAEAVSAVSAFLLQMDFEGLGRPPTRPEAVDVVTAYLLLLAVNCAPTPTPTFTPTPTVTPSATPTPIPGPLQQLAFVSDRDGNLDIFTMQSDGSNKTRLTNNTGNDDDPSWTADGLGIAYSVREDETWNIYRMNEDGSNRTRLTNNEITDQDPDWSPDGSKIAFSRNGDLFSVDADGANEINLNRKGSNPTWSPDGVQIAFFSPSGAGGGGIFVMDFASRNQIQLTNTGVDHEPTWSPDGQKIAFSSTRGGSIWAIYVMDADGTNVVRLTDKSSNDFEPAWSPDGHDIAFISDRDGNNEVYVMNADGSEATRLTNHTASDRSPYWKRGPVSPVITEVDLNGQGRIVNVDTGDLITGSLEYRVWHNADPGAQVQLVVSYANEDGEPPDHALEYACLFIGIPGVYPGVSGTASFVLTAPSVAEVYALQVSQTTSADCPSAAASITESGKAIGAAWVSGPPRFTAFADFSSPTIQGQNFSLIVGPFVEYNISQGSPDGDSWSMFVPGLSYIQANANLSSVAQGASLTITHLSSGSAGAQGGGYSPVGIIINGTLFRDNYDVAENHNFSHSMEVDTWQIGSLLKPGSNTIRIEYENDPAAQTQYWIKEILLKN
ncbi:MAG: hypothetical protein QF898_08985 [SAR202 cluster bacterium]|nr:hypothetical protein [SAR202 cluster bacterium]MDP6512089.1 hypothetical protein [SAR202 cluster bacterium]